jgi:O-antigen/teichoic acid export membrane protein
MSGRQNLLIKINGVTTVLMIVLNVVLVPRWGIVGAGLAAALTVAVTNIWFLIEVRRELKFYPYGSSFPRLIVPLGAVAAVLLLLHWKPPLQPGWLGIAVGMVLAYGVFSTVAFVFSLDDDDRVIARAVWSRIRVLGKTAA